MSLKDLKCDACGAYPATEATNEGTYCVVCFKNVRILVCDFCSKTPVKWSYDCPDFEAWAGRNEEDKITIRGMSRGGWAACDVCHDFIEADDYESLLQRSVDVVMTDSNVPRELNEEVLRAIHQDFKDRRRGEAEPFLEDLLLS